MPLDTPKKVWEKKQSSVHGMSWRRNWVEGMVWIPHFRVLQPCEAM